VREEERELFISLFGDHILLILCVCAISKKYLKTKRKALFDFRFFLPIAGRREGEEQYTHRTNSNLPGESIARERERVLFLLKLFLSCNAEKRRTLKRYIRRENHPLL
jgi:hypothetical protein